MMENIISLVLLGIVAYVQNAFFTLTSRSRVSADTKYHRKCAWGSNGIWFLCQVLIVKNIWTAIHEGRWWYALLAGLIYTVCTAEGSVVMMRILLKTEKGKRCVGAKLDSE